MIKVMFFAHLRDLAGADSIEVQAQGISTVESLLDNLAQTQPSELLEALSDKTAMLSINLKYAQWDAALSDGDEVGFLPPVSGG